MISVKSSRAAGPSHRFQGLANRSMALPSAFSGRFFLDLELLSAMTSFGAMYQLFSFLNFFILSKPTPSSPGNFSSLSKKFSGVHSGREFETAE
jgi:hypothetical protein